MKTLTMLALAALATPAAFAQTYYYPRNDYPLAQEELRRCMDRDEVLASRQSSLESERHMNQRESESIARASATLAGDLRRVDPADLAAVASHNARVADHNARVEAHNLRLNDVNAAARTLNGHLADMQASCGVRTFYPRDRDLLLLERDRLR